jgi:hypothetical protein
MSQAIGLSILSSLSPTLTKLAIEYSSDTLAETIPNKKSNNGNICQPNSLDCFKAPLDLVCTESLDIPYKLHPHLEGRHSINRHKPKSSSQKGIVNPRRGSISSMKWLKEVNQYPSAG